jgi:hypothetical protein
LQPALAIARYSLWCQPKTPAILPRGEGTFPLAGGERLPSVGELDLIGISDGRLSA